MRRLILGAVLAAGLSAWWVPPASAAYCIDQYVNDVNDCAMLDTWYERSACGLVAAARYAECIARAI